MFINPKIAIENGWVSGIKNLEKQLQPNALDFTLDRAFNIVDERPFYISEKSKTMKGSVEIEPREIQFWNKESEPYLENGWFIQVHGSLDCLSDVYVNLPEGICAQLVIRSTLARNGLLLTSGLYDTGFQGHVGFVLHNWSNVPAALAKGTRVGQIMFIQSDSAKLYDGQYNHAEGTALDYQGEDTDEVVSSNK